MNSRFVPPRRSSRLARTVLVATALAAGTVAGTASSPDLTGGTTSTLADGAPAAQPTPTAASRSTRGREDSGAGTTSFVGWDTDARRTADQPSADGVLVAPAQGRRLALQQRVDGEWLTRSTLTLDHGGADVARVALTRHWRHAPTTRWRLQASATATAAAATSAVKEVTVTWEATDDPTLPTVLVTKDRPVRPAGYEPERLVRPEGPGQAGDVRLVPAAARAIERLAADADAATGRELVLVSGFRSADYQEDLFGRYAAQHGTSGADRFSARSGHSEHQTGWAVDVTEAGVDFTRFGGTPSSDWVAANAWRYGYVVRYPAGGEEITGYDAEPWHLRYVGEDLATYVHRTGTTLEEAFGVA
ncbi:MULTISPECIES: M15 family metallopeptidase [unclassified Isoptericola]|uniref:M15 family metallopeptidase n=1 Tax=unclassified Isoptericola TaxID=2623355 RepID=UPI0027139513|nr:MULTISPECIES: M15 family metallopeptidase [unclassified Isoptericola]MDO8145777.1 M15 family metallopeptidase [Isoptericola sp. 178]MDO8149857.1 M15 family metallopeptidase [Isoptericola sp. b408]